MKKILIWKRPDSGYYRVEYIFRKNHIFISGDLGCAVFSCTWGPKAGGDWEHIGLDYFAGKLEAIRGAKYVWDEETALKNLKDYFEYDFDELEDEEYKELFESVVEKQKGWAEIMDIDELDGCDEIKFLDKVCNKDRLLKMCVAVSVAMTARDEAEFVTSIQCGNGFDDDSDFLSSMYSCGNELNPNIEAYLIGLQMAKEQLIKKENANAND